MEIEKLTESYGELGLLWKKTKQSRRRWVRWYSERPERQKVALRTAALLAITSRSLPGCCKVVARLDDPAAALQETLSALLSFLKESRNRTSPAAQRRVAREADAIVRAEERRLAREKREADRRAARAEKRSGAILGGSGDAEFRDFDDDFPQHESRFS
jgi:hypothetical protein